MPRKKQQSRLKETKMYMASNRNKTGPICDSILEAAKGFFKSYTDETVCAVSEGEQVGPLFIAKMHSQPFDITKDMI